MCVPPVSQNAYTIRSFQHRPACLLALQAQLLLLPDFQAQTLSVVLALTLVLFSIDLLALQAQR